MKNQFISLFCLFFAIINTAFAGNGWVSSGGDDHPESFAWFTGEFRKIRTCLIVSNDYSKGKSEIASIVKEAENIWSNYYFKNVKKIGINNLDQIDPQFELEFKDCDHLSDLTLYFGFDSEDVRKEKKKYYNPLAFSTLQEFNYESGWGKGFIWFSDLRKIDTELNKDALLGLVLHELGHVYGNSHVANTIMDEEIAMMIKATGLQGGYPTDHAGISQLMHSIDWKKPLYFNFDTSWIYSGHVPFDNLNPQYLNKQKEILKSFFGRDSVGNVIAKFSNNGPSLNLRIDLSDDLGSVSLPILGNHEAMIVKSQNSIFKVKTLNYTNDYQTKYFEIYAAIKGQDGKNYSAIATVNLGDFFPINIKIFIEGMTYFLFVEGSPGTFYRR